MPSDGRTRIVDSEGVRLHVRTWARDQRGTLLIHGLASTSRIWDLVAPRLARLGVGAVAYDQRGHGRSAKPSSGYGFERTSTDAAAVIRATGLRRPIVVGHSWGANVALELAVRRPRLVAGALLLDGGFASMRERFEWATAKAALAPPAFGRITIEEFRSRIRAVLGPSIPDTPEVDAVFLSLVRVDGEGLVHPRLARANHLRILRSMWEQDTDDLLRRVRVPTLVVAARTSSRGPDTDGFARAKASAAGTVCAIGGRVSFEWIEGVHDVPLQRPEAVARRIERFSRTADLIQAGRS